MEVLLATPAEADRDGAVERAVERLRQRLYRRTSDRVVCDLLADDLSEARGALESLWAYLDGLVAAIGDGRLGPEALFDRALDPAPLDRVDELSSTLTNLRRRVALVAGRERLSATSRSPRR